MQRLHTKGLHGERKNRKVDHIPIEYCAAGMHITSHAINSNTSQTLFIAQYIHFPVLKIMILAKSDFIGKGISRGVEWRKF